MLSHTYKLELLTSIKVYLVFQVSLLEPIASNPPLGQVQPLPPPVIIDEELEWEVDEIVNSKFVGKTLKYLVRWVSYTNLTWESNFLFANAPSVIKRFHLLYTLKPRPQTLLV